MSELVKALSVYCLLALLGAYGLVFVLGAPAPILAQTFLILSAVMVATCAALAFGAYVMWLAVVEREPSPFPRIRDDCAKFLSLQKLVEKLAPMVLAFLLIAAFGTYKSLITKIQPFYLDGFLSDLDRALLGTDPWRITHSFFGPLGTTALELAYRLWFVELSLSLLYFSIFAGAELKRRFFLAYFLLWSVMGFVMATALSSAGPCFLGLIHHPYADRYAGLFPLLKSAPVTLAGQQLLAAAYTDGKQGAFLGISAMPSLHVAFAALVAAAAGRINRAIQISTWAFWAAIVIGSVHLGYHYLSDSIVGTLGAVLIWISTRRSAASRWIRQRGT